MKTVLVTGGAGYLGNIIVKKLIENEFNVIVLDNITYSNPLSKMKNKKRLKIVKKDIRDLGTLLETVDGVDSVIHLAAIVGDPASSLDPQRAMETNYLATKMLVDCCNYHSVDQFIFASTCSVYGKAKSSIVNEKSELKPISYYANHKISSEEYILKKCKKNTTPLIFRMGTLFGLSDRMRFDLVINRFAALGATKKTIQIEGGRQWRPFVHVSDASDAYIHALNKRKRLAGIINVGSDELNETILNVGKYVKDVMPSAKMEIKKIVDQRSYKVSFKKAKKLLNFESKISIKDGILEIANEFKKGKFRNWDSPLYNNNSYLANKKELLKQYYFA